jgi:chemotaxis protein CheD
MGQTALMKGSGALIASAVGSCVVVTLYDGEHQIAAMAHAMLPSSSRSGRNRPRDARYVDTAIDALLRKMTAHGSRQEDVEAKIVGGANIFPDLESRIGEDNVAAAKAKLKAEGIELAGESVGGSIGRSVELCPTSGIVTVKMKF